MTNNNRIVEAADTALSKVDRKKRVRTAAFYIGALIAGAVLGYIGNATVNSITDVIATVYTRLFSFIAVPVIAVSLMATLSKLTRGGNGGTIFAHTVFYTLLTTITAAAVGALIYIFVSPANVADVTSDAAASVEKYESLSYLDHIVSIVPNNLFQPFVSGNVLSVLLVAAAFGLAIASLKESEGKNALISFISGFQELLFKLIHWLIAILPLGILAFTSQLVSQLEAGVILGGIAQYFGVVISSNLLQMFIILPAILLLRGLNPFKIARGMLPALAVALFSKSSAGTLPVTIASAEDIAA